MQDIDFQTLERIAVVRALPGLGDFLCAIPALRALRAACPKAQITLIGLPSNQGLAERFRAYIDEFVELPGYPGLPEQTPDSERLEQFLVELRSRQLDLAIQMHGSGVITNALTLSIGAPRSAGFFLPPHPCPDVNTFLPFEASESEIRRYLRLFEFLGIPRGEDALEFPIQPAEEQELETLKQLYQLQGQPYVCLHAGASVSSRRWAGSQFAAVADAISQMGYSVILTGSVEERGLAEAIAQMIQGATVNLAGRTSLGALAGLLRDAKLLICNDTGVSHLAAAVQVKSVVIFSQSNPERWAPLNRDRHRSLSHPTGASISAVLEQARDLLQQERAYA